MTIDNTPLATVKQQAPISSTGVADSQKNQAGDNKHKGIEPSKMATHHPTPDAQQEEGVRHKRPLLVATNRKPGGGAAAGGLASAFGAVQGITYAAPKLISSEKEQYYVIETPSREKVSPDTLVAADKIDKQTYDNFYKMANVKYWPLFHNLTQYRADLTDKDSGGLSESEIKELNRSYTEVNTKFADALVAEHTQQKGKPIIWVQDYHFLEAAMHAHQSNPKIEMGLFLHIPFPNIATLEQFDGNSVDREGLENKPATVINMLDAMLHYREIGFQTSTRDLGNFIAAVKGFLPEADIRADMDGRLEVFHNGRHTAIMAHPISIDSKNIEEICNSQEKIYPSETSDNTHLDFKDKVQELKNKFQQGNSEREVFFIGGRQDFTKGYVQALEGFGKALEQCKELDKPLPVLVMASPKTRESIEKYAQTSKLIEANIKQITTDFASKEFQPIFYHDKGVPFDQLPAYYRSCSSLLLPPEADGMNLMVKEFLAANKGIEKNLIIGENTGATIEFKERFNKSDDQIGAVRSDADSIYNSIMKAVLKTPNSSGQSIDSVALAKIVEDNPVNEWATGFHRIAEGLHNNKQTVEP